MSEKELTKLAIAVILTVMVLFWCMPKPTVNKAPTKKYRPIRPQTKIEVRYAHKL